MSLHDAEELIKEADKHGGKESKSAEQIYIEALSCCGTASASAKGANDLSKQAETEAKIGQLYFKCLFKGDREIPILTKAERHYSSMQALA